MHIEEKLTRQDVADLNAAARAAGARMGPRDRGSLARAMGYETRTIERWTTTAGQQRNIIPRSAVGKNYLELTPSERERYQLASFLSRAGMERDGPTGSPQILNRQTMPADLGNSFIYLQAIEAGYAEPYLAQRWNTMRIANIRRGVWEIEVSYTRDEYKESRE